MARRKARASLVAVLDGEDEVARVGEPLRLGGDLGMLLVYPDSAPPDAATSDLVTRLRADVLPPLEADTGVTYLVGGSTAAADDFAAAVADRLPLFLLVVVGLSALLLVAVFRSLLIPLKAAVLNLLSIGASLGVVTLVFAPTGPVEVFRAGAGVRDRVRAVDGLRGVPRLAHARGVAADRRRVPSGTGGGSRPPAA